jgi:spore maturation protein CgeB
LVDPRRYLTDYFEPGKDLVTFENIRELKEKISYYLAHPEERIKIANQGRQTVLAKHTYQHRMHEMLSIIYSLRYEQLKARVLSSPWTGMIEKSKRHPELHARCEHAFKKGEEPTLDALVADIVTGKGELTETEQKLLFLYHVSRQTIRMKKEEMGIS